MRVLLVGAGGVGTAIARTAARWNLFERVVVADYDVARAQRAAAAGERFRAVHLDAGDEKAVSQLLEAERCDVLVNAVDPRFVMPLFRAALAARVTYLDMAMSLSHPHPDDPYAKPGVKLGDEQFALDQEWESKGLLALVGMGVEPGLADVFARYAATSCSATSTRSACGTAPTWSVEGYDFAPTFSIWTTIEECLNPPVIWERGTGAGSPLAPFSEPEVFDLPRGHRPGRVRQRRARGGAADAALDRLQAGSPSSTGWATSSSVCSRPCTSWAWTAPTPVSVGDAAGVAARRGGRLPARPGRRSATA